MRKAVKKGVKRIAPPISPRTPPSIAKEISLPAWNEIWDVAPPRDHCLESERMIPPTSAAQLDMLASAPKMK